MNFLLDTHAFIWALFDSSKLSDPGKGYILNPENNIFVSIISFWEISLKYNLGKISFDNVTPDQLPSYAENSGFSILNLEPNIVASFHKLPIENHKDPFDRLIIWQSINSDIPLISKDIQFEKYKKYNLKVIW